MSKASLFTRITSKLLISAAPAALVMASPTAAQVTVNAGTVDSTATGSGTPASQPTFVGIGANNGTPQTSTITMNDSRTILNWSGFNLTSEDTLNFVFSSNTDIVLNRVNSGATNIAGSLFGCIGSCPTIGGNIWFVSNGGVIVSSTATINTGGLLLSTGALTDADFFASNFNFLDAANSITVGSGADLTAANGAITLMAPLITFAGNAIASGSIALIGATDAHIAFDGDLDAYLGITINEGSSQNVAIDVTGDASFDAASVASGGKTYLIAAGNGTGLGSIVLGGVSANRVEFVEGDVVIYAAGNVTAPRSIVTGGVLQGLGSATGGGDVTIGAANVSAGNLNTIAVDDVAINDVVAVAGNARFEAGSDLTINTSVIAGGDYTIRADDWFGAAVFNPNEGGDINIEDTAGGLTIGNLSAADELRITTENGNLTVAGGAIAAANGIFLTTNGANGGAGFDISLQSDVTETGADGTVSLVATGAINQTAGTITAGTLTGSSGGATSLTEANAIAVLGDFSASGLELRDIGGLTVTGAVQGGVGGVSLSTSGDLTSNGSITSTTGAIVLAATGAGSDISINHGIGNGSHDLDLTAGGDISLNGTARGRDIALSAGGAVTTGALTVRDDVLVRAQGPVSTGAVTSGTTVDALGAVDAAGASDALAGRTLTGHTVRIFGNGVVVGPVRANGSGSDIALNGGATGIGNGSTDLDLMAGGRIILGSSARGRDISLVAGGNVLTNSLTARDDVVVRSQQGFIRMESATSGSTVDGLGAVDVAGAADSAAGASLAGHDVDMVSNYINTGAIRAFGTGSDIRLDGGTKGIGYHYRDLDLYADGSIVLSSIARGQDVAIVAGGQVIVEDVRARDDIYISGTDVTHGSLLTGIRPVDVNGAADAAAGTTLEGNQVIVDERL